MEEVKPTPKPNRNHNEIEMVENDMKHKQEEPRYNLRSRNTTESTIQQNIPREIKNLNTSYNNATKLYESINDGDAYLAFRHANLSKEFEKIDMEMAFLMQEEIEEPTSFDEAWNHKSTNVRKKWREAIRKEFKDMMNYKVWTRFKTKDVPTDRRLIGNKWVFKINRCGRFRAQLCGLGYTQIPGIDFTENHAPVVNDVTYRILLLLKIMFNWEAELLDVETAFLNGYLEEQIYMKIPKGAKEVNLYEYINEEEDCLELNKCIYGTVQSARQWYKRFV